MPRDGHSSLTVSDETFEVLKQHKPDRETWDEFLSQAARMANPYPGDTESKLHLHEHTRSHLDYVETRDTEPDGYGKIEVYYWGHGKKFLTLPHPQITDRLEDDDALTLEGATDE